MLNSECNRTIFEWEMKEECLHQSLETSEKKVLKRMDERMNGCVEFGLEIKLSFDRVTFTRKFEHTLKMSERKRFRRASMLNKRVLKTKAKYSNLWRKKLKFVWVCVGSAVALNHGISTGNELMVMTMKLCLILSCIAISCQVEDNRVKKKLITDMREQVIASPICWCCQIETAFICIVQQQNILHRIAR